MPFASHECRWFWPGRLDGAHEERIVGRFIAAGGWARAAGVVPPRWPDAWRTDRYLCLPAGAASADVDLGIKLRDERPIGGGLRLEYKARTASLGVVVFTPDAVGVVERWAKWSYAAGDVPPALVAPLASGELGIEVEKTRIVRRVRMDPRAGEEEIPWVPAAPAGRALSVELAKIRTRSHGEHWSLGLEATPPDASMADDFRRAASPFLADLADALALTRSASSSYPAWLARLGEAS